MFCMFVVIILLYGFLLEVMNVDGNNGGWFI